MQTDPTLEEMAAELLLQLRVPTHRIGYRQLCVAIPRFARDYTQSLSKELYPFIAEAMGYSDWRAVEHSIRDAIVAAWKRRDPAVWSQYFSSRRKPPSNKCFISTLAEYIK